MASFAPPKSSSSGGRDGDEDGTIGGSGTQVVEQNDDEIREDLIPVRQENEEKDTNQIMKPELIQPSSMTQGVSSSNPLRDVSSAQKNVSDLKATESTKKNVYGKRAFRNGPKPPRYEIGKRNPAVRNYFFGDANAALTAAGASWEKDSAIMPGNAGYDHTAMTVMGRGRQGTPSLHAPQIRMREFSSSAEFDRDNKKFKIACAFHAQGWCIRGSSCRFLHMGSGSDALRKKVAESSNDYLPSQASGEGQKFSKKDEKLVLNEDVALGHTSLLQAEDKFRCPEITYSQFNQALSHGSSISKGKQTLFESRLEHWPFKIPSNGWEPSHPFRTSHFITRNLLMKENLYDPLHSSIAPTISSNMQGKSLCCHEGSSVKSANMESDRLQEEPLNSAGNMANENKLNANKPSHNIEGKKHEIDIDLKKVNPFQLESKALKCFRAALIEYVKELLEPAWLEGLLARDAFRMTVRKSVEKIIGSFQPEHIPSSPESVKLYISSCQTKIDRLVQAHLVRCNLIWMCWKKSARQALKKLYHRVHVME